MTSASILPDQAQDTSGIAPTHLKQSTTMPTKTVESVNFETPGAINAQGPVKQKENRRLVWIAGAVIAVLLLIAAGMQYQKVAEQKRIQDAHMRIQGEWASLTEGELLVTLTITHDTIMYQAHTEILGSRTIATWQYEMVSEDKIRLDDYRIVPMREEDGSLWTDLVPSVQLGLWVPLNG